MKKHLIDESRGACSLLNECQENTDALDRQHSSFIPLTTKGATTVGIWSLYGGAAQEVVMVVDGG